MDFQQELLPTLKEFHERIFKQLEWLGAKVERLETSLSSKLERDAKNDERLNNVVLRLERLERDARELENRMEQSIVEIKKGMLSEDDIKSFRKINQRNNNIVWTVGIIIGGLQLLQLIPALMKLLSPAVP